MRVAVGYHAVVAAPSIWLIARELLSEHRHIKCSGLGERTPMFSANSRKRLYYRVCCFVLFFIAASASFHGYYEQVHFFEAGLPGAWDPVSFERMVDGTAERPYVYRQLLPSAANLIDSIMPQAIKTRLLIHQGNFPTANINAIAVSPTARNKVYFFRYLVIYIATFLFAFLAVYGMYFVCDALHFSPLIAAFSSVTVILLVPYIQSGVGGFYDYPELAFLAWAVWIALKFEWWWIIPVAALGAWNKESFLLIIPSLYPIFRLRSSRLGSLLGVGVLCSICGSIYFQVRLRFAHNPGSTVVVQWLNQLRYLLHPRLLLFATTETYGVRVFKIYTVLPMILLAWTVWRGWRHLPPVIQRHGQIAAAINIPLYLLFCDPGEMRDLSMLYVVFLLLLAVNLNEWISEAPLAITQS
jgi:hypothetical protein